jgi:hypothetical protein
MSVRPYRRSRGIPIAHSCSRRSATAATLYRPVAGVADVAVERRTLTTYSAIEEVA